MIPDDLKAAVALRAFIDSDLGDQVLPVELHELGGDEVCHVTVFLVP